MAAGDHDSFVIADVPGLIEGAHQGTGLGHRFLKHVERCQVLVHLITWEPAEDPDPQALVKRFDSLEKEMELFDPNLAAKPRVIAISKIDLAEVRSLLEAVTVLLASREIPLIPVSSVTGEGLDRLVGELYRLISCE